MLMSNSSMSRRGFGVDVGPTVAAGEFAGADDGPAGAPSGEDPGDGAAPGKGGATGFGASNRWTCSLTSVPASPRTRSRASSGVRPSRVDPSTLTTMSPALRPAASAGEPASGVMITRWQSGPNVAQSAALPAASTAPISAPIPSKVPEMSLIVPSKSTGSRNDE